MMANRLPSTIYGGGALAVPWRQFISAKGWVGDMTFGPQGASVTVVIDVNWDDLQTALVQLLGISKKSGIGIDRQLPMRHPTFPWLVATRVVRVEGVRFRGFDAKVLAGGAYAAYDIARISVSFEPPLYRMLPNGPGGEWNRWVEYRHNPATEFVVREKGQMVWNDVALGVQNGKSFTAPIGYPLAKTRLQWVWHQVPMDGLFDANNRMPQIENGIGLVNSAAFAGYPAETLLLEGVAPEPQPLPIDAVGDGFWRRGLPPVYYKVTFHMIHFDPPNGGATVGWNLEPYHNGLWYRAGHLSDPATGKFFTYNFPNLFTMN